MKTQLKKITTLSNRPFNATNQNINLYLNDLKHTCLTICSEPFHKEELLLPKIIDSIYKEPITEWPLKLDNIKFLTRKKSFSRNQIITELEKRGNMNVSTNKDDSKCDVGTIFELHSLNELSKNINEKIYLYSPKEAINKELSRTSTHQACADAKIIRLNILLDVKSSNIHYKGSNYVLSAALNSSETEFIGILNDNVNIKSYFEYKASVIEKYKFLLTNKGSDTPILNNYLNQIIYQYTQEKDISNTIKTINNLHIKIMENYPDIPYNQEFICLYNLQPKNATVCAQTIQNYKIMEKEKFIPYFINRELPINIRKNIKGMQQGIWPKTVVDSISED